MNSSSKRSTSLLYIPPVSVIYWRSISNERNQYSSLALLVQVKQQSSRITLLKLSPIRLRTRLSTFHLSQTPSPFSDRSNQWWRRNQAKHLDPLLIRSSSPSLMTWICLSLTSMVPNNQSSSSDRSLTMALSSIETCLKNANSFKICYSLPVSTRSPVPSLWTCVFNATSLHLPCTHPPLISSRLYSDQYSMLT